MKMPAWFTGQGVKRTVTGDPVEFDWKKYRKTQGMFYFWGVLILVIFVVYHITAERHDQNQAIAFAKQYVAQKMGISPNDLALDTDHLKVNSLEGMDQSFPERDIYAYDVSGCLYNQQKPVYFSVRIVQNKGQNKWIAFEYKGPQVQAD